MIKVIKAGVASTEKRKIDTEIQDTVSNIIDQIDSEGDDALRRLSAKFDKWDRQSYRLSQSEIEQIVDSVPESVKDDIKFAQKQIRTLPKRNGRPYGISRWRLCREYILVTRTFR